MTAIATTKMPAVPYARVVVATGGDEPALAPRAPVLELRGVSKGYGRGRQRSEVLDGIDLAIADGEFVAIVGFSGSGKTTLVNLLAGLAAPDRGEVLKAGQPVRGPGPDRGVVFQNYALLPWLSVTDNVALAVDRVFANRPLAERAARVDRYVEMVGLGPARGKRPAQLSGGMRQRVAVARALAGDPDVLLLDEPLGALDALTRAKLQDEIMRIWSQDRKTVMLITNDVDEALILADRIIPLDPGPRASLGPSFRVDLPRPRDRREMNHDAAYKDLRRAVTAYLIDAGGRRAGSSSAKVIRLPALTPNTATRFAASGLLGDSKAKRRSGRLGLHGALADARERGDAEPQRFGDDRYVEFSRVGKAFATAAGAQKAVDGFDLKIRRGEFVSIIGHSGCGKSTVLSMAAGLIDASEGGIILDGREVDSAGPDRGIVFQSPSLVPWLTAYENVALGVERVFPHATRPERRDMVEYHLGRVGLSDAMHKRASELSNGMKQRVGIARAFALAPKLLLLDEPFGMLDSLTRWELQDVLMEVWARNRVTAIVVTHDVDEAILLADRVAMMTNGPNARVGRILAVDIPRPRSRRALLDHPRYYEYRRELLSFLDEFEHGAAGRGAQSPAG